MLSALLNNMCPSFPDCKSKWMVPVGIVTSSSPTAPVKTIVLDDTSTTVTLDGVKAGDWVKVRNAQFVVVGHNVLSSNFL